MKAGSEAMKSWKTTAPRLVVLTSAFFAVFLNFAFFRNVIAVYPLSWGRLPFLLSLCLVLACATALILLPLATRYTLKPVLIFALLASSIASYFMNAFNVVIDADMLRNAAQTNRAEARDLLNPKLFAHFFLLGVLPSLLIYRTKIRHGSLKSDTLSNIKWMTMTVVVALAVVLGFSRNYASFFREHKPLRLYANPIQWMRSTVKYSRGAVKAEARAPKAIGADADIPASDTDRELVILVVGEAVRADRFSLNGYVKQTNPLLSGEEIVNFPQFYSCGTSTAVSVPCMFSVFPREECTVKKAHETENLLDVLTHAGVHVLWRDNNSSSKGVADRVLYENFQGPEANPLCDVECRDEGMLSGLQEYIDRTDRGDILIVLHQMGNHGPAYYKRYPAEFERFQPVCRSNQLEECTDEQIENAYANAVLYTDYFLSRVIDLLKRNSGAFETAMVYMGDHGESLGENGIYLHGLPYFMAPEAQTHVPAVMWFGDSFKIDRRALRERAKGRFSHDNLFHTMLGMMEVRTAVYDRKLDILARISHQRP
ncbi:MAG: phosphoethanolamine--lipid A transferase [Thermodesulfobacteriota bacterium]